MGFKYRRPSIKIGGVTIRKNKKGYSISGKTPLGGRSTYNTATGKTTRTYKTGIKGLSYQTVSGGKNSKKTNGCYIATAVYGSYDCPEVWTLRRYRDTVLDKTWYGRMFIRIYYFFSPKIVKLFGNTNGFHRLFRKRLDLFVSKLQAAGFKSTEYKDKY